MLKAYEYRIYPTSQQEEIFNKTLGLCRLYWNTMLGAKNADNKLSVEGYHPTFEKYKPEALEWVKEVDSVPLSQTWSDLKCAFSNFFKSAKKQRKGKFVEPPKFKSKHNTKDSFRYSTRPQFKDGKLWLTRKLGLIDIRSSCRFAEGRFRNITFNKTKTGKWFVKICVEKTDEKKTKNGKAIGIDWNCKDDSFLTMSDGTKIKCPRFLKRKEIRLAHLQRLQSKKFVKGVESQSKNYEKAKKKVAVLHEKVAWQRKDWLHKLSRDLANKYEFVVVEDINLQAMAQMNHGRAIGDQGFGMFRQMLSYKTNLVKVPAAYTSQTCHTCGFRNTKLTLSDREWQCPVCGEIHDRDVNAARNILRAGKVGKEATEVLNACGEPRSSVNQESSKPSTQSVSSLERGRVHAA